MYFFYRVSRRLLTLARAHGAPIRAGELTIACARVFLPACLPRIRAQYRLLEASNFPLLSWENLLALVQVVIASFLVGFNINMPYVTIMYATASLTFFLSTFVGSAPFSGRNWFWRRTYGILVGRLLCSFMAAEKTITGCSHKGFLMHCTASRMIKLNFIKESDLDEADSFAIVRNPYSRMVSVYMYNRLGPLEPFDSFVRDWVHNKMRPYREKGLTSEWDVYCHALPMYEFTHAHGKQIVKAIIKQEELSKLWFPGITARSARHEKRLGEIPAKVRDALKAMPHTNARSRDKPWWDYFTQETQDLVAEAFAEDFVIFGYSFALPNRPDLTPPKVATKAAARQLKPFSSNLDFTIYRMTSIKAIVAGEAEALKAAEPAEVPLETIREGKETTSLVSQASSHASHHASGSSPTARAHNASIGAGVGLGVAVTPAAATATAGVAAASAAAAPTIVVDKGGDDGKSEGTVSDDDDDDEGDDAPQAPTQVKVV